MPEDSSPKPFKIAVSGEGITIDRDVDQATAREVINLLMGGPPAHTSALSNRVQGKGDTSGAKEGQERRRPVSLREFLDESEARRNPDKITVIGEYMSEHEGQGEFSRDDIRSRFKDAGEATPKNFGRDFAWAVSNGWIAEDAKNRGAFYVTKKGRTAIDAKFAPEVTKTTRQKPAGRKRSAKRSKDE